MLKSGVSESAIKRFIALAHPSSLDSDTMMSSSLDDLQIEAIDPRSPEAATLITRLSQEIAQRYEGDDGAGDFAPEDVLMPRSGLLIGRLRGRAVVCGAFRPVDAAVVEIKRIFVEPDARGRGIARRMLAELEVRACRMGYTTARLETGVRQPEAIRLYESAGYHRIENFGIYQGKPLSVCFEKALGTAHPPVSGQA